MSTGSILAASCARRKLLLHSWHTQNLELSLCRRILDAHNSIFLFRRLDRAEPLIEELSEALRACAEAAS